MQTIFWLSIFGSVVGLGIFTFACLMYILISNGVKGNNFDRATIAAFGWRVLPWSMLLFGIACLIVATTIEV